MKFINNKYVKYSARAPKKRKAFEYSKLKNEKISCNRMGHLSHQADSFCHQSSF